MTTTRWSRRAPPEQGCRLTEDLTGEAIEYIAGRANAGSPARDPAAGTQQAGTTFACGHDEQIQWPRAVGAV